jgi:hypothetical protein
MFADILYTVKQKNSLHLEESFIFSYFLKKTNIATAVILAILSEMLIVIVFPIGLLHHLNFEMSSIMGMLFGIAHIQGIIQNKKFFKKICNT